MHQATQIFCYPLSLMSDSKSAVYLDLEATNKFQHIGEFSNTDSMYNEN